MIYIKSMKYKVTVPPLTWTFDIEVFTINVKQSDPANYNNTSSFQQSNFTHFSPIMTLPSLATLVAHHCSSFALWSLVQRWYTVPCWRVMIRIRQMIRIKMKVKIRMRINEDESETMQWWRVLRPCIQMGRHIFYSATPWFQLLIQNIALSLQARVHLSNLGG